MTSNPKLRDDYLDAAAAEALGANPPADSADFARQQATPAEQQAAQDLAQTAAALAAASPYMEPPADLRGKILAATAPATFKMEDYRKATHETGRYWRWGFAAAMVLLVFSSYYSMSLKNQLTNLAAANKAKDAAHQHALAMLVDPNVRQVTLLNDGKAIGKLLGDSKSRELMVVLPNEKIPAGAERKMVVELGGQRTEITLRGSRSDTNFYVGTSPVPLQVPTNPATARNLR